MKVYISGAITNNPQYKEQFAAAEEILLAAGHTVINPAKNQGDSYRELINVGLFELMQCDAIYLLRGYERSTGATLEHDYARTVGLEIMKEYPDVIGVDDVLIESGSRQVVEGRKIVITGVECLVEGTFYHTLDSYGRAMLKRKEQINGFYTPTGEKLHISHELKKLDGGERPAAEKGE